VPEDSDFIMTGDQTSFAEKAESQRFQEATVDEVINLLRSDVENGLKEAEAEKRLKRYGYNEVSEKKVNPYLSFAKKFWGLTAWMLEAIIILSWFLQR
jgi:H+-transporting ATPase